MVEPNNVLPLSWFQTLPHIHESLSRKAYTSQWNLLKHCTLHTVGVSVLGFSGIAGILTENSWSQIPAVQLELAWGGRLPRTLLWTALYQFLSSLHPWPKHQAPYFPQRAGGGSVEAEPVFMSLASTAGEQKPLKKSLASWFRSLVERLQWDHASNVMWFTRLSLSLNAEGFEGTRIQCTAFPA